MTATAMDIESRTLRMQRDFKASPERLFDAFTDPKHVTGWWGPEGMTTPIVEMDLREGGKWRTTIVGSYEGGEEGSYIASGVYKVIERPHRLVYSWGWVEDGQRGPDSTVDLTFTEIEGGTRLTIVHSVFETVEERDDHSGGWVSSLNCLEAYLANE